MKIRTCAALLIAVLTLSLLAGCAANVAEEKLDNLEDAVEHRLDVIEDAAETAIIRAITPEPTAPAEPSPQTVTPEPIAATEPAPTQAVIPTEPAAPAVTEAAKQLTVEEAKAIALKHAGFTADQVRFLRAEYEIDDRIPHYDIEFDQGRWEYEYEISAETGDILSYERDD